MERSFIDKCKRCYDDNKRIGYLNEFQICNSCCVQMEQVSPNGFRPNFKFEECKRCYKRRECLNEFQICNSCCNQIEQVTPSGFKPNFELETCKRCYKKGEYLNEFQICSSCHNQMGSYSSGNKVIDGFLTNEVAKKMKF